MYLRYNEIPQDSAIDASGITNTDAWWWAKAPKLDVYFPMEKRFPTRYIYFNLVIHIGGDDYEFTEAHTLPIEHESEATFNPSDYADRYAQRYYDQDGSQPSEAIQDGRTYKFESGEKVFAKDCVEISEDVYELLNTLHKGTSKGLTGTSVVHD